MWRGLLDYPKYIPQTTSCASSFFNLCCWSSIPFSVLHSSSLSSFCLLIPLTVVRARARGVPSVAGGMFVPILHFQWVTSSASMTPILTCNVLWLCRCTGISCLLGMYSFGAIAILQWTPGRRDDGIGVIVVCHSVVLLCLVLILLPFDASRRSTMRSCLGNSLL